MVTKQQYGFLTDGTEVTKYTITNGNGEYAEFLDYGASVHGIYVKDRDGALDNCVLQVSSPEELEQSNMEGSIIGRCANRIRFGKCSINGKEIQLEVNSGGHFLHGASGNYAHRMFSGKIADEQTLIFTLTDTGEGGFGNRVQVKVVYRFDDDDCLAISYEMVPEEATIMCPTNHAYFNLGGLGDIRDHILQINSSYIAGKDESGVPDGRLTPVENTLYDFTKGVRIGDAMLLDSEGRLKKTRDCYDDTYYFDGDAQTEKARLCCPATGRMMTVYSDMEGIILFTPSYCRGRSSGGDEISVDYAAVCLEAQYIPNAVNCPEFKSPVYQAGEKLVSQTRYVFSLMSAGE